jgi:alkylation response protein AidB-like acyl-CoA dehydrogenase
MRVPRSHGGAEVCCATVAEVVRLIAVADPAVAQIPQNHVAFVDTIVRYGTALQRDFFLPDFLRGARLGNALSERGGKTSRDFVTRLTRRDDGSHRLNGRTCYQTGALTAQWIPVFALDDRDRVAVAYVPREAAGVHVDQDWNAFGQRPTFSGTTVLDDVHVPAACVVHDALAPNTFAAFGQLIHVAIDVGIPARGRRGVPARPCAPLVGGPAAARSRARVGGAPGSARSCRRC